MAKAKKTDGPKVDKLDTQRYAAVTPMLVVADVKEAYAFYQKAFGFKPRGILMGPNKIHVHAELVLRDCVIMLTPEGQMAKNAKSLGGISTSLYLLVEDVDKVIAKAVKLGATQWGKVEEMFWGVRRGHIFCPDGHDWMIASRIAEHTPAEMKMRMKFQLSKK